MSKIRTFFFLSVFTLSSFSYAQDTEKQMEDSVIRANQAFAEGRFLEAANEYADAFQFYKDYTLKKNEMIAWFQNGDCTPALEAADLYLKNGKEITESDRIDVKAIRVRCELASAKKSLNLGNVESCESHLDTAETIIESDSLPPVSGSEESEEILKIRIEIEVIKKKTTPPPMEEKKTSYLGPIIVGAGGVVSATGLVLLFSSLSAESDLQCTQNVENPSCDNPSPISKTDYDSQLSDIKTQNTIGWIGLLGGAATIGVGSFLWLSDSDVNASIDPVDGRYSVSLSTSF